MDAASAGTVSANASVCSGSNSGSLTLTGTFTSVAEWDSSTDGGLNWIAIVNTTTTQNYSNLTTTTMYRASVTNGTCPSAISSSATITVNPITAGGSVAGTTTVCAGSNSGSLTLGGNTGNIIRWQSSDDGGASWSNITNTTALYNFTNLAQTMNYRAVVQSGNCLIENSASATITVTPPSDGGSISSAATVCSETNNGTLVLSGYTGSVQRWEKSSDGGTTWDPIVNTSDNYSYSNLSTTTIYRAVVKSGGCASVNSAGVQITVSAPSVGGTVSGIDTVCNGSNSGTLTLAGYTGSVVRWQSSDDGGLSWSNITNTTGSSTCNYANITATTDYRAVVQNGTCQAINSPAATIVVLPVSDGGSLAPASYSACSGINSGTILLSGYSGNIVRWESSLDGGITWSQIANTSSTQIFNNLLATTLYRAIVQQGQCAAASSTASTISVSPATGGGSVAGSDTVCTGTNTGVLTLSGNTGSVQNWEYSKNGGVTWSNISNTTSSQTFTNLTATTLYRVVIQSGSCAAANSSAGTITVSPITAGGNVLSSTSVCDSTTTGMLSLSGHTGTVLNWESSVDSGSTWTMIANTGNTQIYSGITTQKMFRALVQSGACASQISTSATISLAPHALASFTDTVTGATVIFENTSTSNSGTSFWNFGDNTTSTISDPAHTYTANGTYSVTLIASDSCGSDTAIHTVLIAGLGVNELAYNNPDVVIYPNPFLETTVLRITNVRITDYNLKVYDVFGKAVSVEFTRNPDSFVIRRGNLASGIYFYKLSSPDEIISAGKIVVQ